MKFRVERERTDHGYGEGWCVMDPEGVVLMTRTSWSAALLWALTFATGRSMFA